MKVVLALIIFISLIPLYLYRSVYIDHYDFDYVQDHFHHSQWEIPNSPWGIGDDGLYQYSGYQIAQGKDPYALNPEAPPLGKYIYGMSIRLFNNPYYAIVPLYLLTILTFFLFTGFFNLKLKLRVVATILLITSPLFFSQLETTTLDMFQVCWLILHSLCIFNINVKTSKLNVLFAIFAGLTFGFFISTKFGIFSVFMIIADVYLLWKRKAIYLLPIILLGGISIYIISYLGHFTNGGTLFTWLKGQRWIINYWLHNQPKVSPFFVFISLITGWWSDWKRANEWTPIWTASVIAVFFNWYDIIKRRLPSSEYLYIMIFITGFLLTTSFNFFWIRYLIIILPFLLILFVKFYSKIPIVITLFIIIVSEILAINFVFFTIEKTKQDIKYAFENRNYKDLYNYLPISFQNKYSRNHFDKILFMSDISMGFPKKTIKFTSDQKIDITYFTYFGSIKNQQKINFINENNRWKIYWDWNFIVPGYSPDDRIEISWETYPSGPVYSLKKELLSIWTTYPYVYVIPNRIKPSDREMLLENLAKATNGDKETIRILLYVYGRVDWEIPIGYVFNNLLVNSPAFIVKDLQAREFSCISCIEKPLSQFNLGGKIFLIKPSGEKMSFIKKNVGY